ncbi:Lin1 protein [Candida orthopsilosis Co 90-125]|uniref:Lin1 protein n=1 Tax=Candida orthopsilosis (strain 90-125) TaxID=1136231 RepID=H8X5D7_CANO9|nr:Lin1 protein [Candida orthopsilosis Co 90-125]CCG23393.1 Lin1 protein [Candida orthopsilosis Co 90-125]
MRGKFTTFCLQLYYARMSLRRDDEYYEDQLNSVHRNEAYLEDVDDPSSSNNSDVSSDEEEDKLDTKSSIAESEGDMFASEDEEKDKPQEQSTDGSDDDMFASDDDANSAKQPKQVQFSNNNQTIHLQPNSSGSSNDQSELESDNDESINDYYINTEEFTTSQQPNKKKQPKIEAFNMTQEERDGHFNKVGDYIPNEVESDSDKSQDEDSWASDYTKSDIRKAKLAQAKRQQDSNEQNTTKNVNMDPIEVILASLIELLEPVETPMEALARLNSQLRKSQKSKKKRQTDKNRLDLSIIKESISQITNLCSILINEKQMDDDEVYDMTREEFMRKYQRETGQEYSRAKLKRSRIDDDEQSNGHNGTYQQQQQEAPDDDDVDYGEKIWEFRWLNDKTDSINGPFSEYEMYHWKQNYFENNVEARKLGDVEFKSIQDIQFNKES